MNKIREAVRNSLTIQLAGLAGIILLFLLAAFSVTDRYASRVIKENTLKLNDKILWQVNGRIDEFAASMRHTATALVYAPTTYNYFIQDSLSRVVSMEDLSSVFANTVLQQENIAGIYLYDSRMNQIGGMGRGSATPDFIYNLMDTMMFSNLFYLKQADIPYYMVYYPVYDIKSRQYGTQVGMCALVMKTGNFGELLEGSQATVHTEVYLIDGNNRVVASKGGRRTEQLPEDMLRENGDYYVQVQPVEIEGWRVVSRIPRHEMYSSTDGLKGFVVAAYATAFVLMGLLVYFCYRYLVFPMHKVDRFIRNIVSEPELRMEAEREDEIGTVINSLNQMLDDKEAMNTEIRESQKRTYEAELAKKQLQILAYRNQMNPHFLYNTFECIRAMALYHDADDIAEITMALSKVFRFAVKEENVVLVSEEVDYIREYAKIIDYRFMGKIEVDIKAAAEALDKPVIKLILQPLVENAVFHGLERTVGGGEVSVAISVEEPGKLCFVVEDNGCGMEPEKLRQIRDGLESRKGKQGVGMANIYQRLKLFYGDAAVFDIQSEPGGGMRVRIAIPDHVEEGGVGHV